MLKTVILTSLGALVLSGCAGQTTDPRKGGLLSYNPKAYDQRLQERRNYLASVEDDTAAQRKKNRNLKYQKSKLK